MSSLDLNPRRDIGELTSDGKPILHTPVCLVCDTRKAEHAALKPLRGPDDAIIAEPHEYGVCDPCYLEQYQAKYGGLPPGRDASPAPAPGP